MDFIPSSEALVAPAYKDMRWPDFGHEHLFQLTVNLREENDLGCDPREASRLAAMRERCDLLKAASQ